MEFCEKKTLRNYIDNGLYKVRVLKDLDIEKGNSNLTTPWHTRDATIVPSVAMSGM